MLQEVSSTDPLAKVDYHPRGDGLADIHIRTDITTRHTPSHDGQAELIEYVAKEAYIVSTLTEQEAIEQADDLLRAYRIEHTSDSERIKALEQASLDQAEAIGMIYTQLTQTTKEER